MDGARAVDERLRARLPRIGIAATVMGAVLAAAAWALDGPLHAPGWRYLALAGLCGLGIVAYFATGFAIGAFSRSDLRGALRR
jgi:putative peptidoglycan lipid II flippase